MFWEAHLKIAWLDNYNNIKKEQDFVNSVQKMRNDVFESTYRRKKLAQAIVFSVILPSNYKEEKNLKDLLLKGGCTYK